MPRAGSGPIIGCEEPCLACTRKVLLTILSTEYEKLHNLNSSPDIFGMMHLFQINIRNHNIWHSSMNGKGCWKSDCLNEMERIVNYCKQVFRLKSLITGTVKPAHKKGWGGDE
jgi:hypothetical protein